MSQIISSQIMRTFHFTLKHDPSLDVVDTEDDPQVAVRHDLLINVVVNFPNLVYIGREAGISGDVSEEVQDDVLVYNFLQKCKQHEKFYKLIVLTKSLHEEWKTITTSIDVKQYEDLTPDCMQAWLDDLLAKIIEQS